LYKVLDSSDIVIHVLDARDPLGTRCKPVVEFLRKEKAHKQLVYVLNKVDLVPTWVTVSLLSLEISFCIYTRMVLPNLEHIFISPLPPPHTQVKAKRSALANLHAIGLLREWKNESFPRLVPHLQPPSWRVLETQKSCSPFWLPTRSQGERDGCTDRVEMCGCFCNDSTSDLLVSGQTDF